MYISQYNESYSPVNTWSGAFIGGYDELDSIDVEYWRYNYIANKFYKSQNFLTAKTMDPDLELNSVMFYIDERFLYADSIVCCTISNSSDSSKNYTVYFYLVSNKTVINNGVVDISATFNNYYRSGDNGYIDAGNQLEQQEQTQDIINALTGTSDPNVSSGDFPLYTVDDPTVNFFDYLINRISTVFLTNEEVNLNINIPYLTNGNYVLNSDFFILSGPLLLFIQAFLFIFLILPKINDVHEVIKAMQMGYSDAFIRYFGYGISIDDLL